VIQFPRDWLVTVWATIAAVTLAQNGAVPQKARLLLCGFLVALAVLTGWLAHDWPVGSNGPSPFSP